MKTIALALTAAALFNFPVCYAQSQVWTLDQGHSSINFTVDHLVISETVGRFENYELTVAADKPDFTDAKFSALIQTKSINTNDSKRDEHLKAKDFFNVEKNPHILFEGSKFEKVKGNNYKVRGKLTLNGVTKDVVWDAKFNGIVKDPWGGTRAGLKVSTTLDRYDYGLKYNSLLESGGVAIGQDVRITANFELVKKQ